LRSVISTQIPTTRTGFRPAGSLEVNATAPGHPAHLSAGTNKLELHVEPAIAVRIECRLIELVHACHILAMDASERVLDPCLGTPGTPSMLESSGE
jgi:hypothetical protein